MSLSLRFAGLRYAKPRDRDIFLSFAKLFISQSVFKGMPKVGRMDGYKILDICVNDVCIHSLVKAVGLPNKYLAVL